MKLVFKTRLSNPFAFMTFLMIDTKGYDDWISPDINASPLVVEVFEISEEMKEKVLKEIQKRGVEVEVIEK